MDFDMLFFANPRESSTKSMIVRALAAHTELTNAKLQAIIKSEFGKKISYQAIRQALTELVKNNVLEKNNKLYSISTEWVFELKDLVKILEKSIIRKKEIKHIDKKTTQVTLKNLYELGFFVLFALEHKFFEPEKKDDIYVVFNHLWIPFSDVNKRNRLKSMLKDNNAKVLVKGNSLLDKILYNWFKKFCEIKLGVKFPSDCEYIVHGDGVAQIYMHKDLIKKMDKVYSTKNLLKFNVFQALTDMTYDPHEINVIISRNENIAEQVRERIKSYF